MRLSWILVPLMLACALPALAAGVAAGFAPGSVWLSTDTPRAGEKISITTVLYDGSPSAIEGSVSFGVDGKVVGTAPFSLDAGESGIISTDWIAAEGEHRITAEIGSAIDRKSKATASLANATSSALTVTVLPAPPKPAPLEALDTATSILASSSPAVASAIASAKSVTETIRTAGESFLEAQGAVSTTSADTDAGEVLGAETYAADTERGTPAPGFMASVARTLLPVFRYPAIFYPLFFLILAFILWIIAKRLRHPGKNQKRS